MLYLTKHIEQGGLEHTEKGKELMAIFFMKIKEIVLDGFKSYSQRTVISNFDEHFNAITGLNGSGKSNILDAICFVLGISSLAIVRANHLQELIYKNGQGGVTKANVTILFDNSDTSRSHEAYKKFSEISVRREITLGGLTKCTINGTRVTGEKVRQLFAMSGLNVNNASFLIMQGRITQVIHMKPHEILSMIEESAGTNLYEDNRRKAATLMKKKDLKLEEINEVLTNELLPSLEKLQKEKEKFLLWTCREEELEEAERKVLYAKYVELKDQSANSKEILKSLQYRSEKSRKKAGRLRDQCSMIKRQIDRLQRGQDPQSLDAQLKVCDEAFETLSRAEAEYQGYLRAHDKKSHKITEAKACVMKLQQEFSLVTSQIQEAVNAQLQILASATKKKNELDSLHSKQQALDQGITIASNITEERLREKEIDLARQQAEAEQVAERIAETEQQLKDLNEKNENYLSRQAEEARTIEMLKVDIVDLQDNLAQSEPNLDCQLSDLQEQSRSIDSDLAALSRSIEGMDASRFDLKYPDPEPSFDRSKVKGRVIRLIALTDHRYARAVEAGAGSRLYSVVVDTDQTAQLLLKRKTLGNVTFLPINRMQPRVIPKGKKDLVLNRFGSRAHLALDLLEYARENRKSIEFIFGRFFVCDNREIALSIAYDPKIQCTAVTIDGDTIDPSGIISGGESHSTESKLNQLLEVNRLETRRAELREKQCSLEREIQVLRRKQKTVLDTKNELELKMSQLRNRHRVAEQSFSAHLQGLKTEHETTLRILKTKQEDYRSKLLTAQREFNKITQESRQKSDLQSLLLRETKRAERERQSIEREKKQLRKELARLEQAKERIEEDIRETEEMQAEEVFKLSQITADINAERAKVNALQENYAQLQQELEKMTEENLCNAQECKALAERQELLEKDLKVAETDIQNVRTEQHSMRQKRKNGKTLVQQYEEQYSWLLEVKYDLSTFDLLIEEPRLLQAKKDFKLESKSINKSVSATLERQEQELARLYEKKAIVTTDKAKIQEILDHLDVEKEKWVEHTWASVNQHLSDIFSTMLPGADARLKKTEAGSFEFSVGFNHNWNVTLSELSGGQRSLLALSFILALLKHNPAPIYILDEIDAALDMSHTQSIGATIRKYFANSQFIVVSLKEGMFTNANVLFRTSFHEGRSVVERIALREKPAEESKDADTS